MIFQFLFGKKPALDEDTARIVSGWKNAPAHDDNKRADESRFVVVDVESSGLNPFNAELIAIGAVGVTGGKIDYADTFEIILKQEKASGVDNIIVHGITGTAQREGDDPAHALTAFLSYMGKSPLIAFHATFDETMLKRAMKKFIALKFRHRWIDLAYVLPALWPEHAKKLKGLDDWMGLFGVGAYSRHNALADALATAHLSLVMLEKANQSGLFTFSALRELEKAQIWLNRVNG